GEPSRESILVFVRELALEIDPDILAFQPQRIVQQGLFGVAAWLAGRKIPLPDVLRAGEHAVAADAGNFQRLGHVRAQRRERHEAPPHPGWPKPPPPEPPPPPRGAPAP